MRIGVDPGGKEIKVASQNGVFSLNSCVGTWRERKLISDYGDSGLEIEYLGKKYFTGDLAENESHFPLQAKGISKVHEEGVIRVLFALLQFDNESFDIIVSQPIEGLTSDLKDKFKAMLKGKHELIVNGKVKTIYIESVGVVGEGAISYFVTPKDYLTRIIDIGSGTINGATIRNGKFVDKESFTIHGGLENASAFEVASAIHSKLKGLWKETDKIYLVGGGARVVKEFLELPNTYILSPFGNDPKFANAIGLYMLGEELHERNKSSKL